MTRNCCNSRSAAIAAILISALLLAFVIGCDDDDNGYNGGNGGDNPGTNEVWMRGTAFTPSTLTVSAGTTVTWTNKDAVQHNVTGSGWGSSNLAQNGTFSFTFAVAGNFPYSCTLHPGMNGTITVQ